jgi:hypoxanthine phosphoribosyltransferase
MERFNRRILFSAGEIAARVKEMAREISERHPEGELLFIGILKGSVVFLADLVRLLDRPSEYRRRLESRAPRSIEIAALIDKTGRREKHVHLDYCGFRIESGFVVGYGLDCDECFRYLPAVYVLEEK